MKTLKGIILTGILSVCLAANTNAQLTFFGHEDVNGDFNWFVSLYGWSSCVGETIKGECTINYINVGRVKGIAFRDQCVSTTFTNEDETTRYDVNLIFNGLINVAPQGGSNIYRWRGHCQMNISREGKPIAEIHSNVMWQYNVEKDEWSVMVDHYFERCL